MDPGAAAEVPGACPRLSPTQLQVNVLTGGPPCRSARFWLPHALARFGRGSHSGLLLSLAAVWNYHISTATSNLHHFPTWRACRKDTVTVSQIPLDFYSRLLQLSETCTTSVGASQIRTEA